MMHMSKMFQMYATKDFTNGRDIWLAGICRYLNDAYTSLATKVLPCIDLQQNYDGASVLCMDTGLIDVLACSDLSFLGQFIWHNIFVINIIFMLCFPLKVIFTVCCVQSVYLRVILVFVFDCGTLVITIHLFHRCFAC